MVIQNWKQSHRNNTSQLVLSFFAKILIDFRFHFPQWRRRTCLLYTSPSLIHYFQFLLRSAHNLIHLTYKFFSFFCPPKFILLLFCSFIRLNIRSTVFIIVEHSFNCQYLFSFFINFFLFILFIKKNMSLQSK